MAIADRVEPHRWPLRWLSDRWADQVSLFASTGILLVFTFFALWPQAVTTHNPTLNSLSSRHKPPGFVNKKGGVHTLGTDHMGRDIRSRLVWGARASLTVGGLGLAIGGSFGVLIGLLAGYRGGWFDRIAMRIVDAYLSFPYILIAIVWAALVGTDLKNLIIIVAMRGWVEFARVTRGQSLAIREREYITAVRGLGARDLHIVLRHILPNTMAPILVVAGYQLGCLILLEATLSFLTIGIRPPTPAWGSMLSDARNYLNQAWWTVLFPGLAISLVVMATNFLGDSLRDRLDPSLRGKA
ncbi:ABC transporter permease [Candidatus Entotheonella palauensis]|uniref:ABC transporter permease n=1 Tax=Candidatus Entotheonella palauensis TaxID=93172 RepID=UPI000B7E041B|nr:ABC transporter permease [Candidatus Entotheonella palauensis]